MTSRENTIITVTLEAEYPTVNSDQGINAQPVESTTNEVDSANVQKSVCLKRGDGPVTIPPEFLKEVEAEFNAPKCTWLNVISWIAAVPLIIVFVPIFLAILVAVIVICILFPPLGAAAVIGVCDSIDKSTKEITIMIFEAFIVCSIICTIFYPLGMWQRYYQLTW